MEDGHLERGGISRDRPRRGCYLRRQRRLQMENPIRRQFRYGSCIVNGHADINSDRSRIPSRLSSNPSAFFRNYSFSAKRQSRLSSTASTSSLSVPTAPSISSIGSSAASLKHDTTISSPSALPLASSRLCSTSTLLGCIGQDSASSCGMAVWWMVKTSAGAG
jgi:hypothetical protein